MPVPEGLCGGLKPPQAPTCDRTDQHKRHKATRYLRGVGKTSWEWKTPKADPPPAAPVFQAPPVKVRDWAPKESVAQRCGCGGLKHKCRRWRGLLRS